MPFPGPGEAAGHTWDEDDRALVRDRVETQFVGSPGTVPRQLARLQEATDADELIVTTITHSHADRKRSFSLLAEEWCGRSGGGTAANIHRYRDGTSVNAAIKRAKDASAIIHARNVPMRILIVGYPDTSKIHLKLRREKLRGSLVSSPHPQLTRKCD